MDPEDNDILFWLASFYVQSGSFVKGKKERREREKREEGREKEGHQVREKRGREKESEKNSFFQEENCYYNVWRESLRE